MTKYAAEKTEHGWEISRDGDFESLELSKPYASKKECLAAIKAEQLEAAISEGYARRDASAYAYACGERD